ncbi:MAG: FAD-dependent oxidoreductase, partial [Planctomycetota bacterium]
MRTCEHDVDLCVVGGGLSGLCAALAAARRGASVVLIQDRPVLGGNSSSEIRMWIGGAKGRNNREGGIIEQLLLENFRRNELGNWRHWDLILYEAALLQEGLTLLLNCTCNELTMDGDCIEKVRAWQMTCETFHLVRAKLFADCTGDGILAPLSGAEFRIGREAASEFNEDIEPEQADNRTMGLSLLPQPREHHFPVEFHAPQWAKKLTDDDLPHRGRSVQRQNFWWIELGGMADSIHDAEQIRDELLSYLLGIWDLAKNRDEPGLENWSLDWFGMLPGKRESRRYVGDHILTQNDVRAEGKFEDVVAYGGWSMDDHHPAGLAYKGEPTIFHPAPSPYGIPYRCLYSRNIENLFCGGRAISVTHAALSSTRVMATCAVIGQAIGTAA